MKKSSEHSKFETLRTRAEVLLKDRGATAESSDIDILSLIHELEVHQIQLQMQNEELLRAQQELDESRKEYADLYDSAPVGYVTLNKKGVIVRANSMASDMLQTSKKDLAYRGLSNFIHPEDHRAYYALVREVAGGKVSKHTGEVRLLPTKAESLHVQVEVATSRDGSGQFAGWRVAFVDISGRRRAEEEKEKYAKELELRVLELKEKSASLEDLNIALRVLLKQREGDQKELSEILLTNVRNLVLPSLDSLKKTRMSSTQSTLVEILESHLSEITSAFTRKLGIEAAGLTPTEMRIAVFIRDGKSTADIAGILCRSEKTVETHRSNIRKKLGLQSRSSNLRAHLLKLTQT